MNLLYSSVMSRRRSVLNSLRLFAVLPAFHWSNMTAHASSWISRLCHPLKEDSSNTFHADLPPRKKNTKSRCNTNLHAFNRSCESPIHLKARMHIHPGILKSPWGSQSLGYPTVPPILGNCYALGPAPLGSPFGPPHRAAPAPSCTPEPLRHGHYLRSIISSIYRIYRNLFQAHVRRVFFLPTLTPNCSNLAGRDELFGFLWMILDVYLPRWGFQHVSILANHPRNIIPLLVISLRSSAWNM